MEACTWRAWVAGAWVRGCVWVAQEAVAWLRRGAEVAEEAWEVGDCLLKQDVGELAFSTHLGRLAQLVVVAHLQPEGRQAATVGGGACNRRGCSLHHMRC